MVADGGRRGIARLASSIQSSRRVGLQCLVGCVMLQSENVVVRSFVDGAPVWYHFDEIELDGGWNEADHGFCCEELKSEERNRTMA